MMTYWARVGSPSRTNGSWYLLLSISSIVTLNISPSIAEIVNRKVSLAAASTKFALTVLAPTETVLAST